MNFFSESLTARIKEQVKDQLPQILPKEVSNFAPPVIEALIKESHDEVTLEKVSSQPHSTYEAASTLTEIDRKDKDKDKDPSTGSYRVLKKRKLSKDAEPTTGPKNKDSTFGSSKGTSHQTKSSGSLYQLEEPGVRRLQTQDMLQDHDRESRRNFQTIDVARSYYHQPNIKTKAAQYDLPGIEDKVPNIWSHVEVAYDRYVLWVTHVKINDIEDMLLLVVQNWLTNLSGDDAADFAIALRMFTRSLINVTKPDTTRPDLRKRHPYTPYKDPQGFIYVDEFKRNRHCQEYRHGVLAEEKIEHIGKEKSSFHDQGHQQAAKGKEDDEEFGEIYWRDFTELTSDCCKEQYDFVILCSYLKGVWHRYSNPMIQPEPEGSTQGYPLVSVEVLRFDTSAGNPVKEILLKLNLPDHRIFKDGGIGVNAGDSKLMLLGITYYCWFYGILSKQKAVNEEVQLQDLVDKKKVIINEFTVRRDLQLKDVEGIECLPTATIFEELTRMGKKWVKVQLIPLIPTITQPSTSQPQKKQPRRKQRKDTEVSQPSGPTEPMADETENKVLDLETTKTIQALEIDSLKRRVKKLEKKQRSRTYKLRRLYKVGLSAKVVFSDDEASLGDQKDASKQGRKILDIDADEDITLDSTHVDIDPDMFGVHDLHGDEVVVEIEEPVVNAATTTTTTATTTVADEVEMTLAQTLIEIKSAKPKAKGIVKGQGSKDKGKENMIESEKPLKKKDQIMYDQEVALNLQAQLQAELEEEERISRQKEEEANIALIESWDNTQAMMDVDYQMAQQLQAEEQDQVNTFVDYKTELVEGSEKIAEDSTKRVGTKLEQEVAKKQKIDDDQEEVGNPTKGKDSEVPSTEELRINQEKDDNINSTNNINTASDGNGTNNVNVVSSTVNAAGLEVNAVDPKTCIELPNDPNMPELEDIVYSDDDEDVVQRLT
ncbi:hypothetical protein Tco_1092912 [Tanacetum coccineum]|uniref:Uncharacterized protein n=1 Tax=Tanacetum coccineum TaxID=301880 RepID=A0ABQ5ICG6_9ASTR